HEAIYLPDADGNGIELAADRPREEWPSHLGYAGGPKALDIDDLLATVAGEDVAPQVGPGLRMGHVHLHVGDNTWRGKGVPGPPPHRVGLRHWTVQLPSDADLDAVRSRLDDTEPFDGGFSARDPWGTTVVFVRAPTAAG